MRMFYIGGDRWLLIDYATSGSQSGSPIVVYAPVERSGSSAFEEMSIGSEL